MSLGLADLWALMRLTLEDPRKGLRTILTMNPPRQARVAALVLMAVTSSLLVHLELALSPPDPTDPANAFAVAVATISPFVTALIQGVSLGIAALLIHGVGRARGGVGVFDDALLAVVWLQAIMLVLQVLQMLLMAVVPLAAVLVALASVVLFFWLLINFIAELHGFRSLVAVFLGVIATMVVLALAYLAIMVALIGPEAFSHV